ncbi:sensor histidine kinase [Hymenobacter crusticola]|uniref:histidine kinase n=1 Tax=Hymenobacter crusticola TaxID=1770526 RepID=A0A243W6A0_9BACT|nr:PAS domain-containing sensor histidine kinase [Hymenobacter crusticola]OUJ69171.1 hypothetical protein BXP70_26860 [Hymenobacter crusticola]
MPAVPLPFYADAAALEPFGAAPEILGELLAVSLTGIIFYTPIYDRAGEIDDFTFVYLNPTAQRMMQMPERPTLTHNQQWPHSRQQGTFAFHIDAFESGEPRELNINYQLDGYDNYYRLAARRSGQGLLVSFTDTADQPRSPVEIALRESQAAEKAARADAEAQRQRFYEVLMQLPASVATHHGPALVYELANARYQQLFPSRQILGLPIREALPELHGQGIIEKLNHVYQTGQAYYDLEQETWVDFSGSGQLEQRYFNVFFQALRDAQGNVDGLLNFTYDVTEQVRARQQVQQLNQELEARVQERTEQLQVTNQALNDRNDQLRRTNVDLDNFIYTASHDLKAPISNIEGLLYLLEEELPAELAASESLEPILTRMHGAVERFKRTIGHLTDVTKLQKEHAPAPTALNLAAVVEEVRQDLLPVIEQVGARLWVEVAAAPPILFSEKNLRSVVYNLLSNALKYHAPDRTPHIDVRAHVRTGYTVLEVHDNGLGIEAAHQAKLFTMFQRFYTHVEGSGIGLYMVKRMVENAGGRIEVHSQLGAGTTFFVFLPQAATR